MTRSDPTKLGSHSTKIVTDTREYICFLGANSNDALANESTK